ncbi:alanine racemase [Candidatus Gastranaerophilus sp. (ex Termes propinquus)]|nr:alanine racemase [Candidatus Gastranaerophilus sp. (ex Termes propinquus)]
MGIRRNSFANKHRDAWVEINIGNLEHNICEIQKFIKSENMKIMAVVKADAYGHGAVMCAQTLLASGVEALGVASIDEGLELRENKITAPILVLGAVPIWAFAAAQEHDIILSVFNEQHLEAAKQLFEKTKSQVRVHIKVDTGMNRIGIRTSEAQEFIQKVKAAPYLKLEGIFTHFADCENEEILNKQTRSFNELLKNVDREGLTIHCSSSGAALLGIESDMLRLGIVLWGLTPFCKEHEKMPNLKQVIALKGRITNICHIKKGEGVSYGHSYIAQKDTTVATIPIGYADGVSRNLSGKITGTLNGKTVEQIGRITMDQMMFEINDDKAQVGDIITLLDENLSINNWAKELGTINYELTCRLKVRLPRIYTR